MTPPLLLFTIFCFFSILLCFVPRGVDLKKAPFFSSSSSTLSNRHDDRVRVNNSAKPLSSKKAERDKQVKSVHLDTVLLLGSFLGNKYTDLVQPTSNETKKPELIFVRYSAVYSSIIISNRTATCCSRYKTTTYYYRSM